MKKAILIDSNYGSIALERQKYLVEQMKECGIDLTLYSFRDEDDIISAAADSEMMICTGNPPVTRKVMENLPKLKCVLRTGVGVNSVDIDAATELNKVVLFMPGFCAKELAEHATALVMALNRNLRYYDSRIRNGEWPKAGYYQPKSMKRQVLGLMGFGASAQELYKIFKFGFGCDILVYDPFFPQEHKADFDVTFVDFDTVVAKADILSLHLPLNKETRHVINESVFKKMKNSATIVNVGRGELIDEAALAAALDAGEIRFAGLDVFEKEPLGGDSPLCKRDDVVLTCHSAFFGEEASANQVKWAFEMTRDFLVDGAVIKRRVANRKVLDTLDGLTVKG